MLPRKIFENFTPKIARNAPKCYKLVHIFQLRKTIFQPRISALNVDSVITRIDEMKFLFSIIGLTKQEFQPFFKTEIVV